MPAARGSAHQDGERGGVFLTKSFPGVEQKFIHDITAQQLRRERVDKGLAAKKIQGAIDDGGVGVSV